MGLTMTGTKNLTRRLKVIEKRLNQLCCGLNEVNSNYVMSYTMIHNISTGANSISHGLGVVPKLVVIKDNSGYVIDFADLNYDATNITLTSGKDYTDAIFEIFIKHV